MSKYALRVLRRQATCTAYRSFVPWILIAWLGYILATQRTVCPPNSILLSGASDSRKEGPQLSAVLVDNNQLGPPTAVISDPTPPHKEDVHTGCDAPSPSSSRDALKLFTDFSLGQKAAATQQRPAPSTAELMKQTAKEKVLDFVLPPNANPDTYSYRACKLPTNKIFQHRLKELQTWKSNKNVTCHLTIVTQLSLDRLSSLQHLCSAWRYKLAATLYLPVHNGSIINIGQGGALEMYNNMTVDSIILSVSNFFNAAEAADSKKEQNCALSLQLLTEEFTDINDPDIGLYPINAMRNKALQLATTSAVILLDADFVVSSDLGRIQELPTMYNALMNKLEAKRAVVFPSFMVGESDMKADSTTTSSKTADKNLMLLRRLVWAATKLGKCFMQMGYDEKTILLAANQYFSSYGFADLDRWFNSTDYYDITFYRKYEPYIAIKRKFVPWYNEFRGFGYDKAMHLEHIASTGIQFCVHPTEYTIHMPHKRAYTEGMSLAKGHAAMMTKIYDTEFAQQFRNGTFTPITNFC